MPRTGPSQDTVPVSPPELKVPDDGTTDRPGTRAIAAVNVQCVRAGASAATAAGRAGVSSSPPTSATTAATGHLPMPRTVTYGRARHPGWRGDPADTDADPFRTLRPPAGPHGPGPGPAPGPARPGPGPRGPRRPAGAPRRDRRRRGGGRAADGQPPGRGAGAPL